MMVLCGNGVMMRGEKGVCVIGDVVDCVIGDVVAVDASYAYPSCSSPCHVMLSKGTSLSPSSQSSSLDRTPSASRILCVRG